SDIDVLNALKMDPNFDENLALAAVKSWHQKSVENDPNFRAVSLSYYQNPIMAFIRNGYKSLN
ncbi:MAG: hypothetical protein SNJ70_08585, partial [Armatimonadota bacterium]